jgi:hypothetical protein
MKFMAIFCATIISFPAFAFLEVGVSGGYSFFNQESMPSSLDEGGFPALEARAAFSFGPLKAGLMIDYLPAYDGEFLGQKYQLAQVPVVLFAKFKVPAVPLYAMAGTGLSFYTGDKKLPDIDLDKGAFTWMLGAGLEMNLPTPGIKLGLDIGLRYFNIRNYFTQTCWALLAGVNLGF